jgi:hypothetical protein
MNALWFCEMWRKSFEMLAWLAELPNWSVDAVAIKWLTVSLTKVNSSRWTIFSLTVLGTGRPILP